MYFLVLPRWTLRVLSPSRQEAIPENVDRTYPL
jgi:hypothetical protein